MMSAILEIPEVRQRVSRLTVQEYHRLDEFNENGRRTELIRGIIIEKMSKSPLHSAMGRRLYNMIKASVPAGFVVCREDSLTFADSEPEPEVAVVRGSEEQFFRTHPTTAELVVEIAVSSAALDRENASLYAEAAVKEYWIVLASQRQIEVYSRPQQGRYQELRIVAGNDVIESKAIIGVRLRVSDLFV